jgi:DNA-binding MarR family transcriptional regulator
VNSLSTGPDAAIGENLRILTQVMGDICQRSTLIEAGGGTLTANQLAILRILRQRQQLTATEFARLLRISNAAVSKILDRLVTLGLVARGQHPRDRRSASLVLQPAGEQLLARVDAVAERKIAGILTAFADHEKPLLLDFLQRLIRHTLADEQDVDLICYQCGGRCGDSCVIEHSQGTCTLTHLEGD